MYYIEKINTGVRPDLGGTSNFFGGGGGGCINPSLVSAVFALQFLVETTRESAVFAFPLQLETPLVSGVFAFLLLGESPLVSAMFAFDLIGKLREYRLFVFYFLTDQGINFYLQISLQILLNLNKKERLNFS